MSNPFQARSKPDRSESAGPVEPVTEPSSSEPPETGPLGQNADGHQPDAVPDGPGAPPVPLPSEDVQDGDPGGQDGGQDGSASATGMIPSKSKLNRMRLDDLRELCATHDVAHDDDQDTRDELIDRLDAARK